MEKEKKYINKRNVNILKKYNHILKIYEKNDKLLIYSKIYIILFFDSRNQNKYKN